MAHNGALRWGIIGTGMMGLEHARNIAAVPGAELVAVSDPDEGSRGLARLQLGADFPVHEESGELLARPDVDAVVIASPNHTHVDVLPEVLAAGKHLLVEKPLCTTVEDCRRMAAAAEAYPGLVWVGMEYRYMPPVARLIDEVRAGSVGRLRMLAIREHRFPFLPKVGNWNRFARNTGGTLVEKCCHFFDLMRLITDDEPVRVFASGAMDVNHLDEEYDGERPDILDNAYVVVDFAGGARALLDLCMFAEGSENQEEIAATGDRGKVECFVPASTLRVGRRERAGKMETREVAVDQAALKAGFHHGATYFQHRAFLEAVQQGRPPAASLDDGLRAVAIGVAAERSAAEHRPVLLADLGL